LDVRTISVARTDPKFKNGLISQSQRRVLETVPDSFLRSQCVTPVLGELDFDK